METKENKISEAAAEAAKAETPAAPAEKNEYYDQLLRLKAEFENYRKRVDRDRPQLVKTGRWEVLAKFLPVYDVLLAAHKQLQASPEASELAKGVELVYKEFDKIFKSEGVFPMEDAVGRPYDPEQHEVLGVVETGEKEPDTVVDVLQQGFLADGKVLRSAKVRIAKKPEDKK
jgi:molecular chaperone GrpE